MATVEDARSDEAHVLRVIGTTAREVPTLAVDIRARGGEGTHDARVDLRRLRSLLATYAPLLDPELVRPLRTELRWLFTELGAARDAEVLADRLRRPSMRHVETDHLVAHAVEQAGASATSRALDALGSQRYAALLGRLDDLAALVEEGPRAGDTEPRACVARLHTRLRRLLGAVVDAAEDHRSSEQLHEARKAAKQLRYSIEPLAPAYGKDARRLMRRAQAVQRSLGDVQDVTLARRLLRTLADGAASTPAQTFELGRLDERERLAADVALRRFARDRAKLLDGDPRWLR